MKSLLLFRFLLCMMFLCSDLLARAQQVADTSFTFPLEKPAYPLSTGPVVYVDGGHQNFHTLSGRYAPFGKLLTEDGYQVKALLEKKIVLESLKGCDVLVVSNPLNLINETEGWKLPTPSAFTAEEIEAIRIWVMEGGSFFLIADHMPFAGAAGDLASVFGVRWLNGFGLDNRKRALEKFYCGYGLNCEGTIIPLSGDTVITFTGSAFYIEREHIPLIELGNQYKVLMPSEAWKFQKKTPEVSGEDLLQLACMEYGKGRIVFGGEAAMFTAQLTGPDEKPVGFNVPEASGNCRLLLSLMAWLVPK